MSEKRDDGGPAFPHDALGPPRIAGGEPTRHTVLGMTLRDYYAGKAMYCVAEQFPNNSWEENAEMAYDYADAMLKERSNERGA